MKETEALLGRRVAFLVYEDRVIFWLVAEEVARQDWGGVGDLLHWSDAWPAAPGPVHCRWDQFDAWGVRWARILKIHGNRACKSHSAEFF